MVLVLVLVLLLMLLLMLMLLPKSQSFTSHQNRDLITAVKSTDRRPTNQKTVD